ncbi:hypothetical protein FRB96_003811 [Tulasnella sp. 330]|nr:hypothetical protein FRB96_003811 [Tulasnella sp. 330]
MTTAARPPRYISVRGGTLGPAPPSAVPVSPPDTERESPSSHAEGSAITYASQNLPPVPPFFNERMLRKLQSVGPTSPLPPFTAVPGEPSSDARYHRTSSSLPYTRTSITDNRRPVGRGPKWLLMVFPPSSLVQESTAGSLLHHGPPSRFLNGTLIPLQTTVSDRGSANLLIKKPKRLTRFVPSQYFAQLNSITREFGLPSPIGICLYLQVTEGPHAFSPRLSDDTWSALWAPFLSTFQEDRAPSLPSSLPIAGRIEFDLDLRQAKWYQGWMNGTLNLEVGGQLRDGSYDSMESGVGGTGAGVSSGERAMGSNQSMTLAQVEDVADGYVDYASEAGLRRRSSLASRYFSLGAQSVASGTTTTRQHPPPRRLSLLGRREHPDLPSIHPPPQRQSTTRLSITSLQALTTETSIGGQLPTPIKTYPHGLSPIPQSNVDTPLSSRPHHQKDVNSLVQRWRHSSTGASPIEPLETPQRSPLAHTHSAVDPAEEFTRRVAAMNMDDYTWSVSSLGPPSPLLSPLASVEPRMNAQHEGERIASPTSTESSFRTSWGPSDRTFDWNLGQEDEGHRYPTPDIAARMIEESPITPLDLDAVGFMVAGGPRFDDVEAREKIDVEEEEAHDVEIEVESVTTEHSREHSPVDPAEEFARRVAAMNMDDYTWSVSSLGPLSPLPSPPLASTESSFSEQEDALVSSPVEMQEQEGAEAEAEEGLIGLIGSIAAEESKMGHGLEEMSTTEPLKFGRLNGPASSRTSITPSPQSSTSTLVSVTLPRPASGYPWFQLYPQGYPELEIYPGVPHEDLKDKCLPVSLPRPTASYPDFQLYPQGYPVMEIYPGHRIGGSDDVRDTKSLPVSLPRPTASYPDFQLYPQGYPVMEIYPGHRIGGSGDVRDTKSLPVSLPRLAAAYPDFELYPEGYPVMEIYPGHRMRGSNVRSDVDARDEKSLPVSLSRPTGAYPDFELYPPGYPSMTIYPDVSTRLIPFSRATAVDDLEVKSLPVTFAPSYPTFDLYPVGYPSLIVYPDMSIGQARGTWDDSSAKSLSVTLSPCYPSFHLYPAGYPSLIIYPDVHLVPSPSPTSSEKILTVRFTPSYPTFDLYPAGYPSMNIYPAVTLALETLTSSNDVSSKSLPVRLTPSYPSLLLYPPGYPLIDIYPNVSVVGEVTAFIDEPSVEIPVQLERVAGYPVFDMYPSVYPVVEIYPSLTPPPTPEPTVYTSIALSAPKPVLPDIVPLPELLLPLSRTSSVISKKQFPVPGSIPLPPTPPEVHRRRRSSGRYSWRPATPPRVNLPDLPQDAPTSPSDSVPSPEAQSRSQLHALIFGDVPTDSNEGSQDGFLSPLQSSGIEDSPVDPLHVTRSNSTFSPAMRMPIVLPSPSTPAGGSNQGPALIPSTSRLSVKRRATLLSQVTTFEKAAAGQELDPRQQEPPRLRRVSSPRLKKLLEAHEMPQELPNALGRRESTSPTSPSQNVRRQSSLGRLKTNDDFFKKRQSMHNARGSLVPTPATSPTSGSSPGSPSPSRSNSTSAIRNGSSRPISRLDPSKFNFQ